MLRLVVLLLCCVSPELFAQASSEPVEHNIEVTLNPESGAVRIRDQVRVRGGQDFRFTLAGWLDIEAILLDGSPVRSLRQDGYYVVALPALAPQEILFELRGQLPLRDSGQVDAGGMLTSSGTDGVYLPGYDAWIPQPETSPLRYRLKVTVPPGQVAVATGRLVEEQTSAESYQASFEANRALEPPSLFVGPYQVSERFIQDGGLRLRTYFHPELAGFSGQYLTASERYLQRYQTLIGDYPYADFHIVSAPIPVGFGFPNLTYVGRQVIPLPFMRGRSLAHEVLHSWWGNGVGIDYRLGNWAEGLTTYLADYALEVDKGGPAARSMRVKWLRDYAALPVARDYPVAAFTAKQHQASQVIGYNKVAFIFHMLRNEIGQASLDEGLRLFWSRHRQTQASWRDLQIAFEQAAGRQLDWFFIQWLQRVGAPQLSIGTHDVAQLEQGYQTRIQIQQDAGRYRFKLPILLTTESAEQRFEVEIMDRSTLAEFFTATKPVSVQLDPDSDIFRRLLADETPPILRDITLDPSSVTLIAEVDAGFREVAGQLASRIMDTAPRFVTAASSVTEGPLLLITTPRNLAGQLQQLHIQRPTGLTEGMHSAAVWTAVRKSGSPALVISAADTEALRALLRPLPHYGGQSYLLFAASRAISRGIWPISGAAMFRDLGS